jgi:fucose permease
LLPRLSSAWALRDGQSGLLLASLFLGSFLGTLLISANLQKTLHAGAWFSFAGFICFSASLASGHGFAASSAALFLAGLGMGQLMSSINLIVGQANRIARPSALSKLAALWCVGAIASPLFTSVIFTASSTSIRLALLGVLFLIPTLSAPIPTAQTVDTSSSAPTPQALGAGIVFALIFFFYGGIEASITGWLPLFAIRMGTMGLGAGQWIVSLLWIGLAGGRLMCRPLIQPFGELRLLKVALLSSATVLAILILLHSKASFTAGCVLTGCLLGPVFPITLSIMIGYKLSNRVMGAALASCALGSAILPSILGLLSGLWHSLQLAMLLPVAGLLTLLLSVQATKLPMRALNSPDQ